MKDLDGLIARVEQATGNDPELFREAWHACCADEAEPFSAELAAEARFFALVSVEAFVDAALGLMERVLPNSKWGKDPEEDQPTIEVWFEPTPREPFREWDLSTATAATAPLAIVLATLKALQSLPEGDVR